MIIMETIHINGNHTVCTKVFFMTLSGHNFALGLDLCIGGPFLGPYSCYLMEMISL